jgi:hypothetical protein
MDDRRPTETKARLNAEAAAHTQIELLRSIARELEFTNHQRTLPVEKSIRRMMMEWLFAGGALLAVAGTSLDYLSDQQSSDASIHIAACARADEAIRDETLSISLTESEKQAFKARKLHISQKCDRDTGL